MTETLWAASVMRQVPVVLCRSKTKLKAGLKPWAPAAASALRPLSPGPDLPAWPWHCRNRKGVSAPSQSQLGIRGLMGGQPHAARRSDVPRTLQETQSSSRALPPWPFLLCLGPSLAPRWSHQVQTLSPALTACPPAPSAFTPATLQGLCTCWALSWNLLSSLHLVNFYSPFGAWLRYHLLQEAFPGYPWPR